MNVFSYKDLLVWQKSIDLVIMIYQCTRGFPKEEIYGLTSQLRRAASSIPANIAEGSSRGYRKEYINFLYIAFASGAELETHLLISKKLKYLSGQDFDQTAKLLTEIMKMLNGLIRKLRI